MNKKMKRCKPCQLATACVPWGDTGEFLESVFRRQVNELRAGGFENLYIFGTAGEGHAVTNTQFRRIASVFFEETKAIQGMRQLGIIGLSTGQVCERIEIGLELGFSEFQFSLPSWGAVNDRELKVFFTDVLGNYPDARFLHYNTGRGGRVLNSSDYVRLADEFPNLVATKSGGHTVASLLALLTGTPQLCHFITELDYSSACLLGLDCGLLVSVSAVNLQQSGKFFQAGQQRDIETLRKLTGELNSIRTKVIAAVAKTGGHMDGAYDKIYARLMDPDFPLQLLSPYQGAGQSEFDDFKQWMDKEMPQWKSGRLNAELPEA